MVLIFFDERIHRAMNPILNNIHPVEVHHRNRSVIMVLAVNVPRISHRIHPMESTDHIRINANVCMPLHRAENVCVLNRIKQIHPENCH